ncbi:MAG: oxygen-independent coproporphyrinogen III oxidase [Pseudomonadota bacterium]
MSMTAKLAKLGLFDTNVPRYTSYPTAPQFSNAIGNAQRIEWLEAIPPGSRISLYLHIPFCRRLCWFCACRTQGTQSIEPVVSYLLTLQSELQLLAQHLPLGVKLSRMHWGGGTPTLLNATMIGDLAGAVSDVLPLAPDAEFSVEVDPNEFDQKRMDALAAAGMTRASIGVQDFDREIQDTIGRQQGFEITRDATEALRAAGVASLNADILFGLPHQTNQRIAATVQQLLTLAPDRVALYGYAHVPWMARRQSLIPTEALPPPEDRLQLFDTARQLFEWDGYRQIGIDHFATASDSLAIAAQAGRLRRNFQGYTDDLAEVLVGIGASAISRFPQGYVQNEAATGTYMRTIRSDRFATGRGHVFGGEDLLRARMIEMVMCDFQLDADRLAQQFPGEQRRIGALLRSAADHFGDVVSYRSGRFVLQPEAQALTRIVARHFDAYNMSSAGHASAI